jgi:hypothetical protein
MARRGATQLCLRERLGDHKGDAIADAANLVCYQQRQEGTVSLGCPEIFRHQVGRDRAAAVASAKGQNRTNASQHVGAEDRDKAPGDCDGVPGALLVGLGPANVHAQAAIAEFQIGHVEGDKLRTPERSCKYSPQGWQASPRRAPAGNQRHQRAS